MWILVFGPIIAGLALLLIAVAVLAAEFVGKGALAVGQVTWQAINPANHGRRARHA